MMTEIDFSNNKMEALICLFYVRDCITLKMKLYKSKCTNKKCSAISRLNIVLCKSTVLAINSYISKILAVMLYVFICYMCSYKFET